MNRALIAIAILTVSTAAQAECNDPHGRNLHPSVSAPCVFPDPPNFPDFSKPPWTLPKPVPWSEKPPHPLKRIKIPDSRKRWTI